MLQQLFTFFDSFCKLVIYEAHQIIFKELIACIAQLACLVDKIVLLFRTINSRKQ